MGSHRKLLLLLVATVALISCKTTEQKHTAATPSARTTAPTLAATEAATSPAKAPKIEEKIAPKTDPVDELVGKVEREYQAGLTNYNAGHLEAAKQSFDRAFNVLLESRIDIHSDERLENELDKLVEGVHNIELAALKEGDGFTEQRSEPAPIDEANEVTFPVDPSIRAKAAEELKTTQSDLPLVLNDAVASYITYFSTGGGRHFLEHGWIRSGRYRDMISRILKEKGVPQDLIYLAQAESGFHPLALSRAGARGMWQFMSSRGSGYGLDRSWWLDDRQDPEKSTRAAAAHLKDLYNQFGDWYLVMAAYNSGPGTVQRAVQRTGYADYWELYKRGVLPAETRNYVPIILAITIMSKNPAQYGLDKIRVDRPVEYDTVKVDYPIDLRLVAECVDSSVADLQDLNPSLTRMTTPKDQSFALHVPLGTKDKFETAVAAIPREKRVSWHYHKVGAGDTLASVAKRYHTTSDAIIEANGLKGEELKGQQRLIIPVTPGKPRAETVAFSQNVTRYTVRKGDTIASVADDFGIPADRLRKWNGIRGKSNSLKVGRVLSIHKPVAGGSTETASTRTSSTRSKSAQVAEAEDAPPRCTKWARRHGRRVCVAHAEKAEPEVERASSKSSRTGKERDKSAQVNETEEDAPAPCTKWSRRHGKRVCVARAEKAKPEPERGDSKSTKSKSAKSAKSESAKLVRHTVRRGETLSSIADEYNTTVSAIRRDNRKVASSLKPGSVLVIKRAD